MAVPEALVRGGEPDRRRGGHAVVRLLAQPHERALVRPVHGGSVGGEPRLGAGRRRLRGPRERVDRLRSLARRGLAQGPVDEGGGAPVAPELGPEEVLGANDRPERAVVLGPRPGVVRRPARTTSGPSRSPASRSTEARRPRSRHREEDTDMKDARQTHRGIVAAVLAPARRLWLSQDTPHSVPGHPLLPRFPAFPASPRRHAHRNRRPP